MRVGTFDKTVKKKKKGNTTPELWEKDEDSLSSLYAFHFQARAQVQNNSTLSPKRGWK